MSTKAVHNIAMPPQRRAGQASAGRERSNPFGSTIVHVSAEYGTIVRTGGLGEAVAGLAEAQALAGNRVVVFVPLYASVGAAMPDLVPTARSYNLELGSRREDVRFLRVRTTLRAPEIIFIDAPQYFARPGIYGDAHGDYSDNDRRFALFALASLAGMALFSPNVDVIHAHDWHAALVPVYLRTDPRFAELARSASAVISAHNAAFQGHFPQSSIADLGLPAALWTPGVMEWHGTVNFLEGALAFADVAVTVSPTHATELVSEIGGFGLNTEFAALGERLIGITNGIDDVVWDPRTDTNIAANYSIDDLSGKAICKHALQAEVGLPIDPGVPLFVMSARLVTQKGLDLILASDFVRSAHAQFVFLGAGERRFHDALAALAQARPENVATEFDFNDQREHRLLAGADFLMMPCLYEPCGLTQMRAQRYGVPVVARSVGGLRDTVDDVTGFLFIDYDAGALSEALARAARRFADTDELNSNRRKVMTHEFGGAKAVRGYAAAYEMAVRHAARAA